MNGVNEAFIQTREDEIRLLTQQYQENWRKKLTTLNASDKVTIDQEIEQLEAKMRLLQSELDDLRTPHRVENVKHRNTFRDWEDKLHKIDFSRVESALQPIFRNLSRREGAALFILRKSRTMGGKWCIQKIKYRIQDDVGNLIFREIGFTAYQTIDSVSFLNRLAERFKVDVRVDSSNILRSTQTIIDGILGSLPSGNTLCLEINIYKLNAKDAFLEWFSRDFWMPLVQQLSNIAQQRPRIRLLAIIAVRDSIPNPCLPPEIW